MARNAHRWWSLALHAMVRGAHRVPQRCPLAAPPPAPPSTPPPRGGGGFPCTLGQLQVLTASRALAAWIAARAPVGARALSSSHSGGRQGERGKATGAASGIAHGQQLRGNLASIVFPDLPREGAAAPVQRAGGAQQTGAKPAANKMRGSPAAGGRRRRRDRDRNVAPIPGWNDGATAGLAGPLRGIGGTHQRGGAGGRGLSAHLTKLWEWARERARVNSRVRVSWLSANQSLKKGKGKRAARPPCEVPAGTELLPGEAASPAQARPAAAAAQPVGGPEHGMVQPTTHQSARSGAPKLDREFWDTLLLQRDPTKGLREVALWSLMYEKSAEADGEDRPVDPTLWWMEGMVRIKWGGGGYLPQSLRRGQESKPVKGEKVLINHVIQVVAQAPCRLRVRWAALLHDVGKPATVEMQGGKLTFTAHERVGAGMVDKILGAYGYDEKFCKEVATLVLRSGRIRMVERFNDQGARRLMAIMGPLFDDLVELYAADCTSARAHRQAEHQARADLLTQHVQAVLDRDRLTSLRSPLNGHDIMRCTGLKPGMQLGRLVRALREDYLRRGPYSASEAYEVVLRMHAQLESGDVKPFFQYSTKRGRERKGFEGFSKNALIWQAAKERSDMVGGLWKPLQVDPDADSEPAEREEVHVLRLRLDKERSRVAQGVGIGDGFGTTSAEGGEVFRDVAVRRDTSLYTLAKVVTHAFDFDFDDDFGFYRRRRGLECPGAEAAYSGIPAALRRVAPSEPVCISPSVLAGQEHVSSQTGADCNNFGAQLPGAGALHEEVLLEQDFELLARACGTSLRQESPIGFRYDALDAHSGHVKPDVEWRPDDESADMVDASNGQSHACVQSDAFCARLLLLPPLPMRVGVIRMCLVSPHPCELDTRARPPASASDEEPNRVSSRRWEK